MAYPAGGAVRRASEKHFLMRRERVEVQGFGVLQMHHRQWGRSAVAAAREIEAQLRLQPIRLLLVPRHRHHEAGVVLDFAGDGQR